MNWRDKEKHYKENCLKCGKSFITIQSKYCSGDCRRYSNGMRTHGHTGKGISSEYRTWGGMKARCYNKKSKFYSYYGGRGITICERWLESFENFLADMGNKPSKYHTIERINNNGNYEPNNCRWAESNIQMHNRNLKLSSSGFRGVTKRKTNGYYVAYSKTYIGSSSCPLACAKMYDIFVFKKYGEFAQLNFPENIELYKKEL